MRKLIFAASTAVVAATFMACGNGTPSANLKTDLDSASYAFGMAQSQGLKDYLVNGVGIDTAYMDDFFKGLNEAVKASSNQDKKKEAYLMGLQIGQAVGTRMIKGLNQQMFGEDSTKTISVDNFMAGFVAATAGNKGLMTIEQASELSQTLMKKIHDQNMEKEFGPNKVAGEKFLAENAKKEGVKTLAGGVQYKVIKEGNGAIPADTSRVKVNYEGRLLDGTVFDSSYKRGEPAEFRCNQVIKGWTEALVHMPAGSVWEVYVPQELAYGPRQQGNDIKPFSMLIFKIELLEVNPKRK